MPYPDRNAYPDRFYPVVDSVAWVARLALLGAGTIQLRAKNLSESDALQTIMDALEVIRGTPAKLVVMNLVGTVSVCAVTLVAPLRPASNDLYTQVELVLLVLTMASVAALPAYVTMRASVARVLELVPIASARGAIELIGPRTVRVARVRQRLLAAAAQALYRFDRRLLRFRRRPGDGRRRRPVAVFNERSAA